MSTTDYSPPTMAPSTPVQGGGFPVRAPSVPAGLPPNPNPPHIPTGPGTPAYRYAHRDRGAHHGAHHYRIGTTAAGGQTAETTDLRDAIARAQAILAAQEQAADGATSPPPPTVVTITQTHANTAFS